MSNLAVCPMCQCDYPYEDRGLMICPDCGHEWSPTDEVTADDELIIKDANGNRLQEGDQVTLIKDLKIKGSSGVLKIGTKAKINRLVDGDHDLDCKVDGVGQMMLKSVFVKK